MSLFSDHPASVGETYWQHMRSAFGFGGCMIAGGVACLAHGLLPFLFTSTGSRTVAELHDRMITHRSRVKPLSQSASVDVACLDR